VVDGSVAGAAQWQQVQAVLGWSVRRVIAATLACPMAPATDSAHARPVRQAQSRKWFRSLTPNLPLPQAACCRVPPSIVRKALAERRDALAATAEPLVMSWAASRGLRRLIWARFAQVRFNLRSFWLENQTFPIALCNLALKARFEVPITVPSS